MKKVITLCLFVFTMILGTESVIAQTTTEISKEASQKTEVLKKLINLDSKQCDQVFEILEVYGKGMASLKYEDSNLESKIKLKKQIDDKMKAVLSEKQYRGYQEYLEEN